MLLKEISNDAGHPGFLTDENEIKDWLHSMNIRGYTILDEGEVSVHDDVNLSSKGLTYIPVNFGAVGGHFDIRSNNLASLKGCPKLVGRMFSCRENKKLKSLEFAPKTVAWSVDTAVCGITSLVGISDIFASIGHEFYTSQKNILEGGLGLVLIKNNGGIPLLKNSYTKPFAIIEKYIGRPEDIYECQAELIDNGFEEYAKL